jgi:hypothetical protein
VAQHVRVHRNTQASLRAGAGDDLAHCSSGQRRAPLGDEDVACSRFVWSWSYLRRTCYLQSLVLSVCGDRPNPSHYSQFSPRGEEERHNQSDRRSTPDCANDGRHDYGYFCGAPHPKSIVRERQERRCQSRLTGVDCLR